jgi:hypothetical protein
MLIPGASTEATGKAGTTGTVQALGKGVYQLLTRFSGTDAIMNMSATLVRAFNAGLVKEESLTEENKRYLQAIQSGAEVLTGSPVQVNVSDNPALIRKDSWALATMETDAQTGVTTIYVHKAFLEGLKNKAPPEQAALLESLAGHEVYEYAVLNDPESAIAHEIGVSFNNYLDEESGVAEADLPAARTSENFHGYLLYLSQADPGTLNSVEQNLAGQNILLDYAESAAAAASVRKNVSKIFDGYQKGEQLFFQKRFGEANTLFTRLYIESFRMKDRSIADLIILKKTEYFMDICRIITGKGTDRLVEAKAKRTLNDTLRAFKRIPGDSRDGLEKGETQMREIAQQNNMQGINKIAADLAGILRQDRIEQLYKEAEDLFDLGRYDQAKERYLAIRELEPVQEMRPAISDRIEECNIKLWEYTEEHNIKIYHRGKALTVKPFQPKRKRSPGNAFALGQGIERLIRDAFTAVKQSDPTGALLRQLQRYSADRAKQLVLLYRQGKNVTEAYSGDVDRLQGFDGIDRVEVWDSDYLISKNAWSLATVEISRDGKKTLLVHPLFFDALEMRGPPRDFEPDEDGFTRKNDFLSLLPCHELDELAALTDKNSGYYRCFTDFLMRRYQLGEEDVASRRNRENFHDYIEYLIRLQKESPEQLAGEEAKLAQQAPLLSFAALSVQLAVCVKKLSEPYFLYAFDMDETLISNANPIEPMDDMRMAGDVRRSQPCSGRSRLWSAASNP